MLFLSLNVFKILNRKFSAIITQGVTKSATMGKSTYYMVLLGINSQKGRLDIDWKLYMYGWVSYWQDF